MRSCATSPTSRSLAHRGPEKHVAAAGWIERTAEERVADHAEILVYHYGEALELMQAAGSERPDVAESLGRALLSAGDRAVQLDVEAAERYFRRAVELAGDRPAERAAAQAKVAGALGIRGEAAEATELFAEAIPVLLETDEVAAGDALRRLSSTSWASGDAERSSTAALEAIEVLKRHPGPELVRAYGTAAQNAAIAGRIEQAHDLVEAGFDVAGRLGVEDVVVLLQARASVRGYQGDARCVDDGRAARDLGLRLGLGRETAIAMNNLADGEAWFLGLGLARETWEQAIQFSRERGVTAGVMWQRGERLRCLYHAGEWDDALVEADEVLAWDLKSGAGPLEVYARWPMAGIHVHRGNLDEAEAQVAALLPSARRSGDQQVLVPGLSMAALVASAAGDLKRTVACLEELELVTHDQLAWRSFCRVEPLRIAVGAGRLDLAEAFACGTTFGAAWDACARLTADAAIAEARGATADAADGYRRAAELWGSYGSLVETAYALLGLGRCGDAEAAREADGLFTRLGARPVLARAA
jgi:tetratricopeptide (TPR) repeat protein